MTPLTPRELDVLRYAAQGHTIADTCTLMFFAEDTVKGHRRRVLQKLGARNMTHAVARAIGAGVITSEGVRA